MDLVDEMFRVFDMRPKPVSKSLYNSVIIELYSKGYVSLSELAEHVEWIDAYSTLYLVAKQLFPYVGISVEGPSEDNSRGEIVLFVNARRASEYLCEKQMIGDKLLEHVAEKISEGTVGKPEMRERLLNTIYELMDACRREQGERVHDSS